MKIIGVMGNGGSGKTTFTTYFEQKTNVGVIHVDDILGEAKRKYFKPFLQPKSNNTTESTKKNPKLKPEIKEAFYRNKYAFKFLMAIRSALVTDTILEKNNEYKSQGKRVIVIDDWALSTNKKLLNKCNHVFFLKRGFLNRREGLRQRDDLSRKELRVSDLPYAKGYISEPAALNVSVIENNGTIKDLFTRAEQEYQEIGELTFDERYSVRGKDSIKRAVEMLEKAKVSREKQREE